MNKTILISELLALPCDVTEIRMDRQRYEVLKSMCVDEIESLLPLFSADVIVRDEEGLTGLNDDALWKEARPDLWRLSKELKR
jgi:hypothetical protein